MSVFTTGEPENNVLALPVKHDDRREGQLMLVPPPYGRCQHYGTAFEVDAKSGDCKCLGCGERVTAIFVLEQLMKAESRWMRNREGYIEDMARLAARSKTKCDHCGQMTRISQR